MASVFDGEGGADLLNNFAADLDKDQQTSSPGTQTVHKQRALAVEAARIAQEQDDERALAEIPQVGPHGGERMDFAPEPVALDDGRYGLVYEDDGFVEAFDIGEGPLGQELAEEVLDRGAHIMANAMLDAHYWDRLDPEETEAQLAVLRQAQELEARREQAERDAEADSWEQARRDTLAFAEQLRSDLQREGFDVAKFDAVLGETGDVHAARAASLKAPQQDQLGAGIDAWAQGREDAAYEAELDRIGVPDEHRAQFSQTVADFEKQGMSQADALDAAHRAWVRAGMEEMAADEAAEDAYYEELLQNVMRYDPSIGYDGGDAFSWLVAQASSDGDEAVDEALVLWQQHGPEVVRAAYSRWLTEGGRFEDED